MAIYKSGYTGPEIDTAVGNATKVVANPTMTGTEETMTSIEIADVKFYLGGGVSNLLIGYIAETTYDVITAAINANKAVLLLYKAGETFFKNQVYSYAGNKNGTYIFTALEQDQTTTKAKTEFITVDANNQWTYSNVTVLDSTDVVANPTGTATHALQRITIQGINYKLQGAALAVDSYQALVNELNTLAAGSYDVGQSIFVKTLSVPDLWIYSNNESTSVTYTYTTDEQFVSDIKTAGGALQIGYYKVSILEGEKIDLTNYVQKTDYGTTTVAGVVKDGSYGVTINADGTLATLPAQEAEISARSTQSGTPYNYAPIVIKALDFAVKAALTDGIGAAYTDAEKLAARTRIGANQIIEVEF